MPVQAKGQHSGEGGGSPQRHDEPGWGQGGRRGNGGLCPGARGGAGQTGGPGEEDH